MIAVALGMAYALSLSVSNEKRAIGHDVVVSEIRENPGNNFLDFDIHEFDFFREPESSVNELMN